MSRTRFLVMTLALTAALAAGSQYAVADGYGPIEGHTQSLGHFTDMDGGLKRVRGNGVTGAIYVEQVGGANSTTIPTARDGGLPAVVVTSAPNTQPKTWEYGSAACFTMDVNSAGPDGGVLLAPDGGVPASDVLYRCVNPSGSVGDLCYKSGVFLASCTARSQVRVVPGGEVTTRLTPPIYGQSSSGAARLECCPISF